ncbi:hypothetical protein PO883_34155 [Massilia sp. DJPM01]|uniref:hypothetical protein n=1 Tax=Massilia sp. DJPM01 TaxID=3024404 RepID=UPI00259FC561|nr:hypothetical protein [Massilia sp. DJPM01]MDM5182214.1 hypothetical protein [Massilia sp. DJPM01]
MQEICDVFLLDELDGSSKLLQPLKIFAPEIEFDHNNKYTGFLGLELKRLKAVSIIVHFRKNGVRSLNIPVKYKSNLISRAEARTYAEKYLEGKGTIIDSTTSACDPMFWHFAFSRPDLYEGGGNLVVDALDGHVWTSDELEEFCYDYLNLL